MGKLKSAPARLKRPLSRLPYQSTAGGFAGHAHYKSSAHAEWAETVKARDRYTCQSCGAQRGQIVDGKPVIIVADHKIEIRDGGSATDPANGETLCQPCHNRKTARAKRTRAGLPIAPPIGPDGWPIVD